MIQNAKRRVFEYIQVSIERGTVCYRKTLNAEELFWKGEPNLVRFRYADAQASVLLSE